MSPPSPPGFTPMNGLADKLQNVMFSKTRTNGMYSNSAARARSARVQSPKREEILR